MVFVTLGLSERGLCLLPVVFRISLHSGDSSMQGGFPDTPRIIRGDDVPASSQISPLPVTPRVLWNTAGDLDQSVAVHQERIWT